MQNNIILYTTQDKKIRVQLYELGDSVYLNQESLAKLFLKKPCFDTSKSSISEHITNILKNEKNLEETYKALKER